MAQFYINKQVTAQQTAAMIEVCNAIKSVKAMVSNANSGLAGIGLASVGPALTSIESNLTANAGKLEGMSGSLSRIVLKYIEAESNIMGISVYENPDFYEYLAVEVENNLNGLVGTIANYEIELIPGQPFTIGGVLTAGYDLMGDVLHFPGEHGIGIMKDSIGLSGESDWKNLFSTDNLYFDQADTLHMVEIGTSNSVSWLSAEGSLEGTLGSLNGQVGVFNAEAHASAYAGLFSEDGRFAPGIGAEAGCSASVFTANGEARLGNQYLGAYANGGVEVGKVGLTGSISAGLYDSDGTFNPSLGAGVEAEAILAQATASAGGTVLGTDIGVTGSVGVGAGAHANIGLQDGVLSFEVGAYLGVGATVGFDIDFNDTYDTMVSVYDSASDWVGDRISDAGDLLSDVGEWASDTFDWLPF